MPRLKVGKLFRQVLGGSTPRETEPSSPPRQKRATPSGSAGGAAADRRLRFEKGSDWRHDTLSRRLYGSYEDYVVHQRSKLKRIRRGLEAQTAETVRTFRRRFALLALKPASSVLCLGARLGHEVMAFIELGHFAVGIDLCPGDDNKHVMVGDFHQLVFADHSVDCVYINSLDHILNLEKFTAEVNRVLKPDGLFLADIVYGYEEGFYAGEFETLHWPTAATFASELARLGDFDLIQTTDLKDVGSPRWVQCVFKPRQVR
jgi:SAM-dependent methyltransferase